MPKIIARRKEFLAGDAKLWIILIGVNHYLDSRIADLSYSASDCQNLAKSLANATRHFQDKQINIYHDFNENETQLPYLENVIKSLELLKNAQKNDTVIFYFSGHTYLEEKTEKPIFCLRDTQTESSRDRQEFAIIPETGLKVEDLLIKYLADCQAQQQIVLLDSCHSGGLSYKELATRGDTIHKSKSDNTVLKIINILQKKARNSQGFYGILSCDKQEKSLEFPQLGHGLFTYFLIKGLAGEAADDEGIISADRLYRYVYYSSLEYIDKSNQFIRYYNQQQKGQGIKDTQRKEIPLQTPRRIVEGSGEFLIGFSPSKKLEQSRRVGLVINGLNLHQSAIDLCITLKNQGQFELISFLDRYENIKENLEECLSSETTQTILIYLSGTVEQTAEGVNFLRLGDNNRLSRDWLLEQLKESPIPQKIIILNCPKADKIEKWVKIFQLGMESQQCIIAAAPPKELAISFNQILVKVLSESTAGLTATEAISQIQKQLHYFRELSRGSIELFTWISGDSGIIDLVLPTQKNSLVFDAGICPYKGLEAFTKQDAFFYYGRENLRAEILNKLETTSFVAVVGASGSGKSSLVQAGVLPVIDRKGLYCHKQKIIKQCQSITFQPGTNPIQSLAAALAFASQNSENGEGKSLDYLQEILLANDQYGLVRYLRSLSTETVVINIDQFEELFTLAVKSEREQFMDLIVEAIAVAPDKLKIIITLRSDFINSCLNFNNISALVKNNHVLVSSILSVAEYREIITKPAQKVGLSVETSLVNRLIEQLQGTSGSLPILQYILEQLWRDRTEGKLLLETYESKIGGIKTALEQKADRLYNSLSKEEKECARCIFLALVQISVDGKYSRRRVFKSDLFTAKYPAELVESTLQKIIDSKLVVTGIKSIKKEGVSTTQLGTIYGTFITVPAAIAADKKIGDLVTVEITHEILISHWNRLREWLDGDRSFQLWQQQLRQSLNKWLENRRDEAALLTGLQLSEARGWFQSRQNDLTANEIEYIRASIAFKEREQKEKQKRIKWELAREKQARRLAEIAAKQEKKARQLSQIIIGASVAFTLILIVFAFLTNHTSNRILKARERTTLAHYNNALVYQDRQKYDLAIDEFTKAIKINPNYTLAYFNRGIIYYNQQQYDKALQDFNKAIARDPNYIQAYIYRGLVYNNQQQYDKALQDFNKAISIDPNYALIYNNRGLVYNNQQQYDKALQDYNKAISIDPNDALAYNSRGVVYYNQQQYDKALQDFNKAISIDPNDALAYYNRGIVYDNQQKYNLALQDYNKAISIDPNYAPAHNSRGVVYYNQQKYNLALQDYNKAISIDPNDADAYYNLGLVYQKLGQKDKARESLQQAAEIFKKREQTQNYQDVINAIESL